MRYRRDKSTTQSDGAIVWYAHWIGGPTLAAIVNCKVRGTTKRYTVNITGEPDTFYSVPAEVKIRGVRVTGYVTTDDNDDRNYYFRPHTVHAAHIAADVKHADPAVKP